MATINERLTKEIGFWSDRYVRLTDDKAAGKDMRLNLENVRRTIEDLRGKLENRKRELQALRHISSAPPVALGGALVIPMGLLRSLRGEASETTAFSADPEARSRIEQLAMDALCRAEEARGCQAVKDARRRPRR